MYFVLMDVNTDSPWPLSLDGWQKRDDAVRAINWQRVGPGQFCLMEIARPAVRGDQVGLRTETGEFFVPRNAVYTEAAWSRFQERLRSAVSK